MGELRFPDKEPSLTSEQRALLERIDVDFDALRELADKFVPRDNFRGVAGLFADDHWESWRLADEPSSAEEILDALEAAIWARYHGEL